jgi:hypothetical protein
MRDGIKGAYEPGRFWRMNAGGVFNRDFITRVTHNPWGEETEIN